MPPVTILREARVLIADWRKEYNQVGPHRSLHNKPPAPEARRLMTQTLQLVPFPVAGQTAIGGFKTRRAN